jgi:hypothetical protein
VQHWREVHGQLFASQPDHAAFAGDLAAGMQRAPTFRDAVRMHELIDAALESCASGCRVPFAPTPS